MERIRRVLVDMLEPGMILGKDIDSSLGNMLLKKGYVLDQNLIDKLSEFHVEYVYILETIEEEQKESFSFSKNVTFDEVTYVDHYEEAVKIMTQISHDVRIGKTLKISTVRDVINGLLEQVFAKNNILYCLNLIKNFDDYTYTHCINVCLLATTLGKWLGLNDRDLKQLAYSTIFHDLGKYKIPAEILNKPSRLTDEEFAIMKQHPVYGYEIVKNIIGISPDVAYGVLMHHEKINGTGYPLGIKGNQIHLFAKIICVADIYDALTSDRVYHKKISPFQAADMISRESFTNIDPDITATFLNNISTFYVGCTVVLNTHEKGKIIYLYPNKPTRPLIELENGQYIDLTKDENLDIMIEDLLSS
ncbi:HD-GYP domain-containing protein [Defluviitalea saccharophila]|uniref:HD-GYP domain-containing protein n=1 Tax=Defluviitalea saccharophila TaxID=879970 RepID=A0ABZ2Y3H2_9FIRM